MESFSHRVRRTAQNIQYTHNLNLRVHDVKTYPVLSPQGATILIYGHDNGVTLVWRGGRRLKRDPNANASKSNAAKPKNDTVMIIDSDDEAPGPEKFVDKPVFEDAPAQDAVESVPEVVQTLDLAFGTAVTHIALLPIAPCSAADAPTATLKDRLVIAVSCATSDMHVLTLPLTPPSHESKERPELRSSLLAASVGRDAWNETITKLDGQNKGCDGLAMSLIPQRYSKASSDRSKAPTRLVVASHSREASGTLRFWDVNLDAKPLSKDPIQPFQTEWLPSPLTSISFNPTHHTQLLAIASPHAARIYDYAAPAFAQDDVAPGSLPTQGSWLLSLYPPFIRSSTLSTARKPIAAASWIARGHAILVLLADGQWGIWDIDSESAPGSGKSLFGKVAGVRGSAITAFNASGQLEGTSPLRNPMSRKTEGEFVPMTPHTRRDAASSLTSGTSHLSAVKGGISVVSVNNDESAVLWLGGADHLVAVIPGISSFWEAQFRRGTGGGVNLFTGGQPSRILRLQDLNAGLMGERCCGVCAVPRSLESDEMSEGLPIEVVVQGESRLVIVREGGEGLKPGLLGTRKQRIASRQVSQTAAAVVVDPRPNAPKLNFDLSVAKRGSLRAPKPKDKEAPAFTKAFDAPFAQSPQPEDITFTQSMFGGALNNAANAEDDEEAAEDRNVEEELLDIMEIDAALEDLEGDRAGGAKHVFFENF